MTLFTKAVNTQAKLKAGLMGFAGSGKTFTATAIAIGLVQYMRERKIVGHDRPIFFLDTETGSDFITERVRGAGIEIHTAKTRTFSDLCPAVAEAEANGSVLIIDSITHFWREFTEAYQKKRNRSRLQFEDWNYLKAEWGKFTDAYVNSNAHIVLCGRAGFEYDYFEDDNGKKQLEKTGIKMKAEGEMGYEPSLLILMEREMADMETKKIVRTANVLKERFAVLDGQTFKNPTFADFLPHIERLNLTGTQLGVDTTRTSESSIPRDGLQAWQHEKQQSEIALDEVIELLNKHHGGQSAEAKKAKGDYLEKVFGTRSWERVKALKWPDVKHGRNELWKLLEGVEYGFVPPTQKGLDEDIPEPVKAAA